MKINVFKTQCNAGSTVVKGEAAGKVIKVSSDRTKALIHYDNGDKRWEEYYGYSRDYRIS